MRRIHYLRQRLRSLLPQKRKAASYIKEYYKRLENGEDNAITRQWQEAPFDDRQLYARIETAIGRKEKLRHMYRGWKMAAVFIAVVLGLSGLYYWQRATIEGWVNPAKLVQKETPAGQMMMITLADGSRIWLNGASRLNYPDQFKGQTREVELSGEAYFEIAADAVHPFVVHTAALRTQVLGTSFNIKAYPGNTRTQVTVLSGSVSVAAVKNKAQKQVLTANQRIIYSSDDGQLSGVLACTAANAVAWKEHRLVCEQMRLDEVLNDVNRLFNVEVQADSVMQACIISADFSNETLDAILAVLAELTGSKVIKQGNHYRLTGKGCPSGGKGGLY